MASDAIRSEKVPDGSAIDSPRLTPAALTAAIREEAARLGFADCGVTPAVAPPGVARFETWLASGYAGEMRYLADRADARADPTRILAGARSIVMLAMNYRTKAPAPLQPREGRVSRYAWGDDYHDVIHDRLKRLAEFTRAQAPGAMARGVVDSAPLAEREFAQMAGLGWIGKNTLLLNRRLGSWFFLGALLTDAELVPDQPFEADHCGACRACLDACPTDAFPNPYVLDATRCVSYLTIELRSQIPPPLRPGLGNWLFGCDICQEVCPWNHKAPLADEAAFEPRPDLNPADLSELFAMDEEAFRRRFRVSPLWRAKRRGLLRNAAIVLGNQGRRESFETLAVGLNDAESLVREACAWALGQIGGDPARDAIVARESIETEELVRIAIRDALAVMDSLHDDP